MSELCIYPTQPEAIRKATADAKEFAAANGCDWTESVLLWSGDTLQITAAADGGVSKKIECGWVTEGLRHASRRTAAVAR